MTQQLAEDHGSDDIVIGRNPVLEAIKACRQIDVLYVRKRLEGRQESASLRKIISLAKQSGVVIKQVVPQKLNALAGDTAHQGVVAVCSAVSYVSLEHLLAVADSRKEPPFFMICDEIEDPHNLGAMIRTAEAAGVHGVILPKRRSASVNGTVYKTSAGAANVVPICRVSNLHQTIQKLKQLHLWIYCADMQGKPWCDVAYQGGVAVIIGSEGKGVSRILKEQSDVCVSLPMHGTINSLNASVAAGIILYEVARQRAAYAADISI